MHRQFPAIATAALTALLIAGCSDRPPIIDVVGVPQVLAYGQPLPDSELTVDFGSALLNTQVEREILIRNIGRGTFTINGATGSADLSPAFGFDKTVTASVQPGDQITYTLSFRPTAEGVVSGSVHLAIANGDRSEVVIGVSGQGVDGRCALNTQALEFGSAAVGSSYPMQVTVLNRSGLPWSINVAPLDARVGSAFEFGAGFAAGDHIVPAASADNKPGELVIPVEFKPSRIGEYSSELVINSSMCPSPVALHGFGVEHVLECGPKAQVGSVQVCRVDFGFATPGAKVVKTATFRNLGNTDVNLTLTGVTQPPNNSAPFAIEGTERSFVVPHGGDVVSIDLSFTPAELGQQFGKLNFASDEHSTASGSVELVGIGGGPKIDVQPAGLDFNKVAVDTFQVRRVTIANVGTDIAGTETDNLRLVAQDESGTWLDKRAEITGPDAAQFTLVWPPENYNAAGLSEGQNADLQVKFMPTSDGRKNATLIIYSNDPNTPALQLQVTGLAVTLPPCDFVVQPPALNFGSVESNKYLSMSFGFVNRNPNDECLVSQLDLSPQTKAQGVFSLVNGPVESVTVEGGQTLYVAVRFGPKVDGTYVGEVVFYVSNPTTPEIHVPVNGVAQPSCLMVAPRELDFGTIGVNCKSRQRLFTMYNTCSAALTITGIDMATGASADFSITKKPALPVTISGGSSAEFGVTYQPRELADDAAAISITVSGNVNPTIVSLQGHGAQDPVQTDVFSQTDQPKVDVMLIIDNSCSMSDKQASLARNFASFIHYAVQQKVDYHIAATTVSLDSASYECGRFVPLTGSNPRVITPSTPNKEQVFSQNVQLGTNGTGTESLIRPAYLALTNPLINGHNAGFYRDEAKLAIVTVSDAADQDPLSTPISFYENFFINLKGVKRRNDFTFSGIIPLMSQEPPYSSGCSYDSSDAGQDPRVKQLITRTGGLMDEICNPDWSKTLEKLGTLVFGRRTTFFLSNVPDLTYTDPVTVMIDGQVFPQYGSKGDKRWDYNSATNAIEFDPLAAPDPGTALSVSYHVACLR